MSYSTKVLIDSDTLSMYMKHNATVVPNAQAYLNSYGIFTFSTITRFEILRGLKVRDAYSRLGTFERLCLSNEVVNLSDSIIVRASDIYVSLRKSGTLIADADILIAATALDLDIPLVSNNTSHFARIPGLTVLDWNT